MLRIRLSRHGAKKDPHYRVVVADRRSPRDGRFLEVLGYYNPALKPVRLKLNLDRVGYWVGCGAQPTQTVRTLIRRVEGAVAAETSPEPASPASEKTVETEPVPPPAEAEAAPPQEPPAAETGSVEE